MYSLNYSDHVVKQLKKLPNNVQNRIISTLERCKVRPHYHVKKLVGNPYYRLRVGDYRVIIDIQDGKLIILVIEVGHRRNIYKQ